MSFMVFVEGKQGPTREHATEAEARAEAERLAQANDGKRVWVLAVVDVLEPVRHHQWRGQKPVVVIPQNPSPPLTPGPWPPRSPNGLPDVLIYGCQPTYIGDAPPNVPWYGETTEEKK